MNGNTQWTPNDIKTLDEGEWRIVVLQQFTELKDDFKIHCGEATARNKSISNLQATQNTHNTYWKIVWTILTLILIPLILTFAKVYFIR